MVDWGKWFGVKHIVETWFFPKVCVLCQNERVPESTPFLICQSCQQGLLGIVTSKHLSQRLTQEIQWILPEKQEGGLVLFALLPHHQAEVRQLLYRIKYGGDQELAYQLGMWIGQVFRSELMRFYQVVVPIPITEKKLKERGYNQALLLAEGVSEATGIPVVEALIIGQGFGQSLSQSEKGRLERLTYTAGQMQVAPQGQDILGCKVLLVDDVLTTGATLMRARELLLALGCTQVDFAVLAHAKKRR